MLSYSACASKSQSCADDQRSIPVTLQGVAETFVNRLDRLPAGVHEAGRRADTAGMEIRSSTWRKYGHDRTYLTDATDTRLGWIDNKSGRLTVEVEAHRAALEAWITAHGEAPTFAAAAAPTPSQTESAPSAAVEEPVVLAPPPTWTDLSTNRPGQAAREQADTHLAEMKDRSKFWTGVARVLDVKNDERAWRVGAKGEETVGARLDKLSEHGWHVLHAVPIGNKDSDIDHLLIGPGGVWTLNTKNHPGKKVWVSPRQVRVDGHVVPYLRNSEFEADRVRRILTEQLGWEPFVKGALVFLTGTIVPDVTIKEMPESVLILDRMDIPRIFKRSSQRLTPDGIAEIYEVARRSTTWRPSAS